MMRVTGPGAVAALGRLQATLRRLGVVPRRTAALAAPGIDALLAAEFATGTDPYGRAWAPLRPSTLAKGRRPPPLTATSRLRTGTRAMVPRARYAGLRLVVGAPYGFFAQVGFRVGRTRVPPRRILPQYGLPSAWSAVLARAAREAARQAVGR